MNKSFKNSLIFFLLLFTPLILFAQEGEILTPCNIFPKTKMSSLKPKSSFTALKLPFYEDFSSTFGQVDSTKFMASTAFVNRSFACNPRTIGSLLMDALDEHGNLYSHGNSYHFLADTILSAPIRLDSIFSGVPHKTTPADSIYFSFFYQPQGLGEAPDENDSLVLEFYSPKKGKWVRVWSDRGYTYQQFTQQNPSGWKYVVIPITDTLFYDSLFQFKFKNFASYANTQFPTWASNGDFWLIDCIYLNSHRTMQDSVPTDLAFKSDIVSLLSDYTAMPWQHFLAASNATLTGVSIPYKNYSPSTINLSEILTAKELKGTGTNYSSPLLANNLLAFHDTTFYRSPLPFSFTSSQTGNVDFKIQFCINTNTITDPVKSNDTVTVYQRFYNYFAMDDGTAEAGYGLSFANSEFTLQFTLYKPDTLRSVLLFFNPTFYQPSETPYFDIVIRNDNNGFPGEIIFEQKYLLPQYNGYAFINYVLNNPFPVQGKIYIGIRQHLAESINIGFDQNMSNKGRLFYNTTGTWYASLYTGVPMIRAVVGHSSEPFVSIEEKKKICFLYPNPVSKGQPVYIKNQTPTQVDIFDVRGKLISTIFPVNNQFLLPENIQQGIYFIRINSNNEFFYERLIVQ
jgi:hypothetical protein